MSVVCDLSISVGASVRSDQGVVSATADGGGAVVREGAARRRRTRRCTRCVRQNRQRTVTASGPVSRRSRAPGLCRRRSRWRIPSRRPFLTRGCSGRRCAASATGGDGQRTEPDCHGGGGRQYQTYDGTLFAPFERWANRERGWTPGRGSRARSARPGRSQTRFAVRSPGSTPRARRDWPGAWSRCARRARRVECVHARPSPPRRRPISEAPLAGALPRRSARGRDVSFGRCRGHGVPPEPRRRFVRFLGRSPEGG
jgi:hypothetical protein